MIFHHSFSIESVMVEPSDDPQKSVQSAIGILSSTIKVKVVPCHFPDMMKASLDSWSAIAISEMVA